jgi:hypothetical protein
MYIALGDTGEFLSGDLLIGVSSAYSTSAVFTATTKTLSCPSNSLNVGGSFDISGKAKGARSN